MRHWLVAVVAVLTAILVQVTVLDSVPFPGGSPPDLVLLVVVTLALASSPMGGAVLGFGAGLATDIAPPASHLLGLDALVFCLVGYACGQMRGPLERSAWLPLGGIALGVVAGESLYALAGMVFGDADITWRAAQNVVPVTVTYDIVLSPFVLAGIALLAGASEGAAETAPRSLLTGRELMPAWGGMAPGFGAVRDTRSGRAPRLKLSGNGLASHGAGGSAGARRQPSAKLRLRGGVAGSAAGGMAGRVPAPRQAAAVNLHLGASRRRGGLTGGSALARAPQAAFSAVGGAARPGATNRLPAKTFSRGAPRPTTATVPRPRTARLRLGTRHSTRHGLTAFHRGGSVVGGGMLSCGAAGRSNGLAPGKTFRSPHRGAHPVGAVVNFITRRKSGGTSGRRWGSGASRGPRFRGSSTLAPRRGLRARLGRRRSQWRPGSGRARRLS